MNHSLLLAAVELLALAAPAVTFEEAFKTGTAGSITYAEGEAVPKERMQAEVQKVLDRAVAEGRQGAVQFCVYIDGECVVDAWAGTYATNSTRKIDGDSLFPIYSTEKQLLVTAAHRAHERGLLDYEKPVKSYWPEFTGSPEKEALTVRELIGHRAGLPSALPKGTALADRTNWNYKVEWFAKQPAKDPGKVSRYLSGSFGVYLGHVLECVYGKPIKEILDEEAVVPAGIARDFFFASGPEEDGRIVTVYNGSEPWSFEKMNETPFRRAIDPAGWAVSSARGIARFYNRLCGFDGQPPLIRPETLDFALRPNRWEGEPVTPEINDKWIMVWGLGYGLWGDDRDLSSVFGQGGLGGSEGMCDRKRRICIGYTCNVSANYDGFNKITPELFRIVGFQTRYTRKGAAERPAPLGGKTELSQARNWFLENVYGVRPEAAERAKPTFAPIGSDRVMMNGAAVRKRVRVTTAGPYGTNAFEVTAFVPTAARRPVPAFLLVCNRDPKENIDPERINSTEFWPAEEIVRRGYAAVAFHNEEVAPDDPKRDCRAGVFACFEDPSAPRAANAWGTLSAWAWGASRAMDWLETLPEIDAKHVAVVGHSRGGKTALLAGVTDRRFALSCSNDSGCSGAKLNRMSMPGSEHIQRIYDVFPHWFCANYAQWKGRDGGVPHDQDRFVAQIAPRLVAIGSAADDAWAGPRAEEACAESARRAWKDPTDVDYHVRPGGHDLNLVDWTAYMDFADRKGWRGALGRVNLFVGTVGAGNLTPAAAYPFGMMSPGPDTSAPGEGTPCPGYRYSDTNLVGFSQQHLNGTGHPGLGDILVFPYCGETADWNDPRQHVLDHAKETATPGYYALTLPQVRAEMTATPRTGCLRFTRRLGAGPFRLLVDLDACLYHLKDGKFDWHVLSNEVRFAEAKDGLVGKAVKKSWGTRSFGYAVAFDRPWTAREELAGEGDRKLPRYVLSFDLKEGEALTVKTAISLRGGEAGAKANLESTPGWTFDGWRRDAEQAWEGTLGLATAEGGPDATLDMFCTSLYRCFVHPNLVSDAGTSDRYTTFSLWDTFRAAHPLYTILTPEAVPAFLDSFLDQFEKNGYLPVWTLADEEINCMIANHSIPVIVDAWKKGLVKDPEPLWRAVRATLRENHPSNPKENWPALDTCGYFPNDVFRREACSRTLEVAYNDWCAAEFAEGLGHAADAAFFRKRSASWKNLFDVSAGLVNSRDSQGAWRRPFDPYSSGWGEGYDFTEGNSWQYSWHVFQNPEGLIAAMGGREAFAAKLTRFFDPAHNRLSTGNVKWFAEADLIGQYWHGNEPCQHVPWFWQLVGEGERTDEIVREVFDRFYSLRPDGLFGNDDCGQMSAWYVFAAMGFYPVNPCGGEYFVSAPQIEKATLHCRPTPSTYTSFTVCAKNLSKKNKYVKSVKLNGHELKDRILRHADILKGGELVFEMKGRAK